MAVTPAFQSSEARFHRDQASLGLVGARTLGGPSLRFLGALSRQRRLDDVPVRPIGITSSDGSSSWVGGHGTSVP